MSVNENLRGIPDRVLSGHTNGRLGLFRVYICLMKLYNTRSLDELSTRPTYPLWIFGSGDWDILESIVSNAFMASS